MEGLVKRRGIIKGQITRLGNFANTVNEHVAYDDLKARLDKLNEHYKEFVELEHQIFAIDANVKSDMEIVDDDYYKILSILQKFMRLKTTAPTFSLNDTLLNTSASVSLAADYKLPRLSLPTFSGKPREWISFFDLFRSTVHDNTSLSPAQKFQYLKGQLRGPAEQLLRHFRVEDASYNEAFQRLIKRYGKKRHIVNDFIELYMSQPSITSISSEAIGRMHDACDEVVRGLKVLGKNAESRDCWLLYIAENKLDEVTRQLWRQETADIDFPSYDQFLAFLAKRMDSLEGLKPQPFRNEPKRGASKPSSAKASHIQTLPNCSLCEGEEHKLCDCPKFIQMDITKRREYIKVSNRCYNCLSDSHSVFTCRTKKRCHHCSKKHHSLVHQTSIPKPIPTTTTTPSAASAASTSGQSASATCCYLLPTKPTVSNDDPTPTEIINDDAIIPTAIVEVQDKFGTWQTCRALLDSASTRSFVTESCIQRLGLQGANARLNIDTLNGGKAGHSRGVTSMQIRSKIDRTYTMNLTTYILPKITSNLPAKAIPLKKLRYLHDLQLADPYFNLPDRIDILVGCDRFLLLLTDGQRIESEELPTAQHTKLGWIVGGSYRDLADSPNVGNPTTLMTCHAEIVDIDRTLRQFWQIEEVPHISVLSTEEQLCLENFLTGYARENDGKFRVALPFKPNAPKLGESLSQALKRFSSLEQKLQRNEKLREQYVQFMKEYQELGHMEPIPMDEIEKPYAEIFYLPHHGVVKESSSTTKLRVVFDASAISKSGESLNSSLLVGPNIQQNLVNILLRFRKHRYVFSGDIEKMFRQIWVHKSDADFQRIIWRDSPDSPLQHYRLLTVTYGTTPASFLSQKSLQMTAEDYTQKYPEAAQIVINDFYMDDVMSGADTIEEATKRQKELVEILKSGGFHLRKWSANHPDLLSQFSPADQEITPREINEGTKTISVLGIRFLPIKDAFSFKVDLPPKTTPTKRILLSEAARIFDPMGWLSPVIIGVKILYQTLWQLKIGWDDELPSEICSEWLKVRDNLSKLESLEIPMWLHSSNDIELIGFADASQAAYAAVIYSRTLREDGSVLTNLIVAKTKVAPLSVTKRQTIPRLELCAAVLLTNLLKTVLDSLDLQKSPPIHLFTDSSIVINWLSSPPVNQEVFVSNRIGQILRHTNTAQWQHVPGHQNPADCASRGILPSELLTHELWWKGPSWIQKHPMRIPMERQKHPRGKRDENSLVLAVPETTTYLDPKRLPFDEIHRITDNRSSFHQSKRILAWALRAAFNFRNFENIKSGSLTYKELSIAEFLIIKVAQYESFKDELRSLLKDKQLPHKSKLISLNPFLDDVGILRVGGRLQKAEIPYDARHPVILPHNHKISEMIVQEAHKAHLHAGPSLLSTIVRQKFAILRCKDLAKQISNKCIVCWRLKKETLSQQMGQLPSSRVNLIRPFLQSSVDYAGPYLLRTEHKRKAVTYKAYLAVFTCMSSKAVHLELVTDLSTERFLAALKRFQNRRGIASDIYSDNGTNFVGAAKELKILHDTIKEREFADTIENWTVAQGTNWHFVPPSAPHFNGLCEAAVKSSKYHLQRVLRDVKPTYEELYTLLTQVEATLNSRPLCKVADDEMNPLTVGHLLIGQPLNVQPEPDLRHLKVSRLSRWQLMQQLYQHFWNRWYNEYLTSLNRLTKWQRKSNDVKIGDIVLLHNENLPAGQWPLGLVDQIHPGDDNLIRVVTVKTSNGTYKRPITKISIIPTFDSNASTGAVCWNDTNNSDTNDVPDSLGISKDSPLSPNDTIISVSLSSTESPQ